VPCAGERNESHIKLSNISNISQKLWIWRSCDRASWHIIIIKPTRCTNFSNLFWDETLHVSDSSFVHHQEFFTLHTAMVYVIQICRQLSNMILILLESCLQTWMTYTIAVCTVKPPWWWTKELSETCRVSFQNMFENLVKLVGYILWGKIMKLETEIHVRM